MKRLICLLLLCVTVTGCGYNKFQQFDEDTTAAWSEVVNQYKRRADLIPNLVKTVQGYAAHEKGVFEEVTAARAKAGSIQPTPEMLGDGEAFKRFTEAQAQVGSSLGRLLAVAENYPQLKADQSFRDLQAQLEGTENRITVARKRYIDTVREYNVLVRSFPTNLTAKVFGYAAKPQFTVENERAVSEPPTVSF